MNKKQKILLFLLIITIAFIWVQSALSVEASSNESKAVTEKIVRPVQQALHGEIKFKEQIVRKIAHIIEFFVLGTFAAMLFSTYSRRFKAAVTTLGFSIMVALCDETVQLFSDRGAQIIDVWIDTIGTVLAIFVFIFMPYAVHKVIRKFKRQRNKKEKYIN